MHCVDKDFSTEKPLIPTGKKLEYSQLKDFSGSFGKNGIEHQQFHYLCLINNCSKPNIKKVFGLSKKV